MAFYSVFAAFFLFGTVLMVGFLAVLGFLEWRDNREPLKPKAVPVPVPLVPQNPTP